MASAPVWITMKGTRPRAIVVMGALNRAWLTKRFSPNGGVNIPMERFTVRMMPKWMRSTPRLFTMGTSSGVRINVAEVGSIRQPTISRKTLMATSMSHGGAFSPWIAPTTVWGTPLTVSSHEKTPDAATMIMIWAVRNTELTEIVHRRAHVMSRYT